jgi:hypothetical protein
VGIDRDPIDVRSGEAVHLLHSFIWAGQDERHSRLERALEAIRSDPPDLVRGDFVAALPDVLATQSPDALTIVFQTAALDYVGEDGRTRGRAVLEGFGATRRLAFVSAGRSRTGESCWGLRASYWPSGERELVAHADVHGSWLRWEL